VYIDRENGAKALEIIAPHIAKMIAEKPADVDNEVLRTFLTGVRANLAIGDLQKAADTALGLAEFAPDQPQTNRILVGFMTMFQQRWKEANAKLIEARTSSDLEAKEAAEKQLKATAEVSAKVIEKLLTRKQLDGNAQFFLARTAMEMERSDLGERLYKALLEKAESGDPTVDKRIVPNCRAELLGIVRKKQNYAEALNQVDKLLAEYPTALPYMMEKGRILQAWAEKDESKFNPAVEQWVDIRSKLQRMARKPPEYYEVNYNAALCLYIESQKKKDPKKAVDAAKLLNALLFTTPKLNGPEMVAQYMDLLKKTDPEGYKRRVEAERAKARALKEKAREKETAAK
jgi:tetratricopeptide (TPR) repeat protein